MLLEQSFGIELLGHFDNNISSLIYHEILVCMEQITAKFDIQTIGFSDEEEILRVVAIKTQKINLSCEKGHGPANLVDFVSNLLDSFL